MNYMMPLDAVVLLVWSACSVILAQEDGSLTMWTRLPVLAVGAFAFWYALWLLSVWTPGPSGYPWQRLVLDSTIGVVYLLRTLEVLIALRRNAGRLFAFRPFGLMCKARAEARRLPVR